MRNQVPVPFQSAWVFSATAIRAVLIYQPVHGREVTFGNLDLELINRWGPVSRRIRVPKSGIAGFLHQVGSSTTDTRLYQVLPEDVHGRKRSLAHNITGESTARELVRRLETRKGS